MAHAIGGPATTIDLTQYFTDEQDGAAGLTYTVAGVTSPSLFSSVSIDPSSQLLTLNYTPGEFGTSYVTVCGTDSLGLRSDDFTVRSAAAKASTACRSLPRLPKGGR